MAERGGREILHEWQRLMESLVASAASVSGHAELPRQLVEPMQRQLELMQQLVERERRLQRELVSTAIAPIDAVFDLLEQSSATLARQAEALEAAGAALEETAALVRSQAELFERTVVTLREPAELAKSLAGIERRPRRRGEGDRR